VPRHVARLVTRLITPLVVDYFASAARPGASACRMTRHAARRAARPRLLCLAQARRRQLRLAQARRRLLCLCRASGCLGTSRGSSRGSPCHSSSTTPPRAGSSSTTPPRRLIVDYFAYAARPGASARHAARRVARCAALRRLLRLRRASGCLGTSCGPSHGSSSTTPCAATSSCGQAVCGDYFSHAVRGDYLSRGNTGSTSSTWRAATTSSSGLSRSNRGLYILCFF
jgi:hypothetical protein